jgi:hypothetical protein
MAEHLNILPQYPVFQLYQNYSPKNLCSTEGVECRKKGIVPFQFCIWNLPNG